MYCRCNFVFLQHFITIKILLKSLRTQRWFVSNEHFYSISTEIIKFPKDICKQETPVNNNSQTGKKKKKNHLIILKKTVMCLRAQIIFTVSCCHVNVTPTAFSQKKFSCKRK